MDEEEEQIVLTPRVKTDNSTTLWIERKMRGNDVAIGDGDKVFVAGGNNRGIVVNKEKIQVAKPISPPRVSLGFRVYLVNHQNGRELEETRTLRFWFRESAYTKGDLANAAQDFFAALVHPRDFPRDYVGFIKRIMKLLHHEFPEVLRIELILSQNENSRPINRPASTMGSNPEKAVELTEKKLVEVLESYYPNLVTVHDLTREFDWKEEEVYSLLHLLVLKGVIKAIEHGGYTRVTQGDAEVQVVNRMPKMMRAHQPSVAIITAQFTEKLAVDVMIDNKETFVRYATIGMDGANTGSRFGESNIYTLGNIGDRRVVCTKLPSIGHTREAKTAAGNTTTRLLGTFQNVDHVILVGVGGGVPHFTDYNKHVRLGDVVVSHASSKSDGVYVSCNGAIEISPKVFNFEYTEYIPKNSTLQNAALQLTDEIDQPWQYLDEGLANLEKDTEHDFRRPHPDTDKIYMAIGERDLIQVEHPMPLDSDGKRAGNRPRLHFGLVGAGREVANSDLYRQKFAQIHFVSSYVSEFDPVIESIIGNCRNSFIFVCGISDYGDGSRKTEWQPYAALAAAAVAKAIVLGLPR